MTYDPENIFAKIIRKEVPASILYEDEQLLAFHDIQPVAPVHVLVIPKNSYTNYEEFITQTDAASIRHFFHKVREIAETLGIGQDFRLVINTGALSGQSVRHFHIHIIGGKTLGDLK